MFCYLICLQCSDLWSLVTNEVCSLKRTKLPPMTCTRDPRTGAAEKVVLGERAQAIAKQNAERVEASCLDRLVTGRRTTSRVDGKTLSLRSCDVPN